MAAVLLLYLVSILSPVHSLLTCPQQCRCFHNTNTVDCDHTALRTVPQNLPHDINHLRLRANNITHLTFGTLTTYSQLLSLDLSENLLSKINPRAFESLKSLRVLKLEAVGLVSGQLESVLHGLTNLTELYLRGNRLDDININLTLPHLTVLDLSHNHFEDFPIASLSNLPNLTVLNMSGNSVKAIMCNITENMNLTEPLNATRNVTMQQHTNLHILDLSANGIVCLGPTTFSHFPQIQLLYLNENQISSIPSGLFGHLWDLKKLNLDQNPLLHINANDFKNNIKLQTLEVSTMPNVTHIHHSAFRNLANLQSLSLRDNPQMEYLHADVFTGLSSLQFLDLSNNRLSVLHPATFQNLTQLRLVLLAGNQWSCDCHMKWLHEWMKQNGTTLPKLGMAKHILCSSPVSLRGHRIIDTPLDNLTCSGAHIVNYTVNAFFQIGSAAILNCITEGNPRPSITWITAPPDSQTLHYHPSYVDWLALSPFHDEYHEDHVWHHTDKYDRDLSYDNRKHILKNGSLYIDYVKRHDAGHYICIAENPYGNATIKIHFKLMYNIPGIKLNSIYLGFASAGVFLLISIIFGSVRYACYKCSKRQQQKRKSIRQLLDSLDAYKTAQFDKLSAYKTAKIDKLSAYKTIQVDKLRKYKDVTYSTLVGHLDHLRDHYQHQMAKIKENCTHKMERVRTEYTSRVGRFKNYKSHQIEKLRENYQSQVYKIRDYSSSQLEKLREQYKLQAQHIYKLLEIINIDNCRGVIEAECMRTESMLFNQDLTLDLADQTIPPVHFSTSESEYQTANSNTDKSSCEAINKSGEPHIKSAKDVKRERKRKHKCSKKHKHEGVAHDDSNDEDQYGQSGAQVDTTQFHNCKDDDVSRDGDCSAASSVENLACLPDDPQAGPSNTNNGVDQYGDQPLSYDTPSSESETCGSPAEPLPVPEPSLHLTDNQAIKDHHVVQMDSEGFGENRESSADHDTVNMESGVHHEMESTV